MKRAIHIGILAVLAVLIVAAATACSSRNGDPAINETGNTTDATTEQAVEAEKNYVRAMAVIKSTGSSGSEVEAYDIEIGMAFTLKVDDSVIVKDAYGNTLPSSGLQMGDMIETKYDTHSMIPEYIRITAVAWERSDAANMLINQESKTIVIGSDRYIYNDELVVAYNDMPYDIGQLNASDEVFIRGYKDTVWSIVVKQGHGMLTLTNHRPFVGGVMTVDNIDTYKVESSISVPIVAGNHSITIEKEGITTYTAEVTIDESGETILDLGDVQVKIGMVDFVFMQEGVRLFIDGVAFDTSEDITLDFGTYSIRAEKENFATFTDELTVNQAYMQYKIDLDQDPIYLHVDTPEECELYIDGSYVGIIPAITPIDPGEHVITIRKEGFYLKNHRVIVDDSGKDIYYAFPELVPMPQTDTQGGV